MGEKCRESLGTVDYFQYLIISPGELIEMITVLFDYNSGAELENRISAKFNQISEKYRFKLNIFFCMHLSYFITLLPNFICSNTRNFANLNLTVL